MSLFSPSHGNLLPETEHGKPEKKFPRFQSGVSFCFVFFLCRGDVRVFLGTRCHFVSTSLWLPRVMFGCVCLTLESVCMCLCECLCMTECDGVCACSWRCGDGVQVLHQALEVGHLLGQLVRLVALRERNRVTARGGGGAGREGGKHLEGDREGGEERRGEERRGGKGQSGTFTEDGGIVWVG